MVLEPFGLGLWACIFPKIVWLAKECSLWVGDFPQQYFSWDSTVFERD